MCPISRFLSAVHEVLRLYFQVHIILESMQYVTSELDLFILRGVACPWECLCLASWPGCHEPLPASGFLPASGMSLSVFDTSFK